MSQDCLDGHHNFCDYDDCLCDCHEDFTYEENDD